MICIFHWIYRNIPPTHLSPESAISNSLSIHKVSEKYNIMNSADRKMGKMASGLFQPKHRTAVVARKECWSFQTFLWCKTFIRAYEAQSW